MTTHYKNEALKLALELLGEADIHSIEELQPIRDALAMDDENAALREKVAQLACAPSKICKVQMLEAELAAAQATIANMRQRFSAITTVAKQYAGAYPTQIATLADEALSLPTNLDALHEARALECERLESILRGPFFASWVGKERFAEYLETEAEAHRARKEEGK